MSSRIAAVSEFIVRDLLGSIAWFPVWWYTRGLSNVGSAAVRSLRARARGYSILLWMQNFFVPMYGQHDLVSRLISVMMRFVVLVGRSVALLVEAGIYLLGILAWILAPVLFVVGIILSVVPRG